MMKNTAGQILVNEADAKNADHTIVYIENGAVITFACHSKLLVSAIGFGSAWETPSGKHCYWYHREGGILYINCGDVKKIPVDALVDIRVEVDTGEDTVIWRLDPHNEFLANIARKEF